MITSIHYGEQIDRGTVDSLIQKALAKGAKSLFILCCDSDDNDLEFFNALLPKLNVPVFGGVFPEVLLDNQVIEHGFVVSGIEYLVETSVYTDLCHAPEKEFQLNISLENYNSLIVFVDGLARNIDFMIQQLFHKVGNEKTVIGGGVGSLSFKQNSCVICNQGILVDAMVVVAISQRIELAIGHGWEKLAGPFLVTQADDNRVESLDFQPALDVYQQAISKTSESALTESNFFEIASNFPFGIDRLDDDMLVRDPVSFDGTSLICVGTVPENTLLYILQGNANKLISAAYGALDSVKNRSEDSRKFGDGILFDCISRKLFLQDEYPKELSAISHRIEDDYHLIGALVLGEIASGKTGTINFHNKTAITGLTYDSASI